MNRQIAVTWLFIVFTLQSCSQPKGFNVLTENESSDGFRNGLSGSVAHILGAKRGTGVLFRFGWESEGIVYGLSAAHVLTPNVECEEVSVSLIGRELMDIEKYYSDGVLAVFKVLVDLPLPLAELGGSLTSPSQLIGSIHNVSGRMGEIIAEGGKVIFENNTWATVWYRDDVQGIVANPQLEGTAKSEMEALAGEDYLTIEPLATEVTASGSPYFSSFGMIAAIHQGVGAGYNGVTTNNDIEEKLVKNGPDKELAVIATPVYSGKVSQLIRQLELENPMENNRKLSPDSNQRLVYLAGSERCTK